MRYEIRFRVPLSLRLAAFVSAGAVCANLCSAAAEPPAQADESNKPGFALVRTERAVTPCAEVFAATDGRPWQVVCSENAMAAAEYKPLKIGRTAERPLAIRACARNGADMDGRRFSVSLPVTVQPQEKATHLLVECGAERFSEGGWGALSVEFMSAGEWVSVSLHDELENRGGVICTYLLPFPAARGRAFGMMRIVSDAPRGENTLYLRRVALVAARPDSSRSLAVETLTERTRIRTYPAGTAVAFRVKGGDGEPAADDTLGWVVVDWLGRTRLRGKVPFPASAWKDGVKVEIPGKGLGAGYFQFHARLKSDGATFPREGTRPRGFEAFGLLPDLALPALAYADDSRFGAQGTVRAYEESGLSPVYETMGFRWIYANARPCDAQPSRERAYEPKSEDEVRNSASWDVCARHGYASLVNMHGIPPWMAEKPADVTDAAMLADPTRLGQKYPLKDPDAYEDVVRRLMTTEERRRRLARPHLSRSWYEMHWEPDWHWSGTDEQFIGYYRRARAAMDAADPAAVLTAANCGVIDRGNDLLERLFAKGLGKYVNGVTTHLYLLRPDWPEGAGLDREVRRLRALTDRYLGKDAPIINTEGGTEFKGNPARIDDLREHAARLVRGHIIALGEGCTATFLFYVGDYGKYSRSIIHYGMFFNEDTQGRAFGPDSIAPKPAAMAAAAMIRLLEGTKTEGRVGGLGDGVYAYAFRRGGERILAVWSPEGPRKVSVASGAAATIYDMMGNPAALSPKGGRLSFTADENPRYVVTAAKSAAKASAAEKRWMCPQMEMELFRVHSMRDDVRRMGLYAGHPGQLPGTRDNVFFRRECAKVAPLPETWGAVRSTRYDEAEGRRYVEVRAGFSGCAAIRSDEAGWEAQVFDGSWRPVAEYPDASLPPHRERLPEDRAFAGLVSTNGWFDAGEELLAHVECASEREPKLFVGESIPEMMDENRHHFEYDATMVQVADGMWRTHQPLAFRYLRFASDVRGVKVVPVGRNRAVLGRVITDNPRWGRMFDVGVRTLARCSDEFLIDGVKRDRLPWAGDLTVSLQADAYVYGDAEVARRSLSVMDAYQGDVNGIVTYSMWTIISHDLYQLHFGDRKFLEDRWWRIKWRIENLISRTDENGFVAKGLGWVFVDWAKPESKTAMHMIWYGALEAAARLADRMGDACAADYRALAEKVRANLDRLAWDGERGLYRADPGEEPVFGRQANIFAVVFGAAAGEKASRIGDELAADRLPPVGTPYVFGWELIALSRTGHHQAFFDGLERVFGGMLDAGATTFWEGYDAAEKGDDRYRFYGRPWGKSLCHVWSAWPAFVFVSEAMGAKPTSDGWKTWTYNPIPGAEGLSALVPTPNGVIEIGLKR